MNTNTEQLTLIKCTGQECESFKGLPFQDKYTIEDAVIYKEKDTGEIRLMDLTLKCNECWGEHKITNDVKNPKSKYVCPVCRDSKSKYNNMSVFGHQVYANQEILGFCNDGHQIYFKVQCLKCKEKYLKDIHALLTKQKEHKCNPEVSYKDWIGKEIANQKILGFCNDGRQTCFKVQCLRCKEIYSKQISDLLERQCPHRCNPEVLYKDYIGQEIANQKILGFCNNEYRTCFKVQCLRCKEIYLKEIHDLLIKQKEHKCNAEVLYKDLIGKEISNQKILGFCNNGNQTCFKVQCLKCKEIYSKEIANLLSKQAEHKCKVEVLYKDWIDKEIANQKILGFCKNGCRTCFKVKCLKCKEIYLKEIHSLLTEQYEHQCIRINTDYFDESYLGKVFGLQKIIGISKDKSKPAKWTLECTECGKIKIEIVCEVAGIINKGDMLSCDCTLMSAGAILTERSLKELGYTPIKELSFGDLKDTNLLRYDFAIMINEQLILIEYDGKQHTIGWGYNKESLEYIQSHDKMKDDYAKEHGYPLIRISHLVQLEDIKDYLKDEIDAILEELNSEAGKDSIPK